MHPHSRRPSLRRSLAASITVAVAAGLAAGGAGIASAGTPVAPVVATSAVANARSSFTLPILPDTQFYSRYSAEQFYPKYGTNPFEVQTNWIVENKDELNIPFVAGVGDVVDQQWVGGEWEAAKKALGILTTGGITYSVVPGNHDTEDQNARSSEGNADNYRAAFGASALSAQVAATGGNLVGTFQDGLSSAYLFEAEGHQWMSLGLAWNASDDTFAWAQGILNQYPNVPVVLTSHSIINIAEDQTSPTSWWWGDVLWDSLVSKNDQIILTVNGHFHGATQRAITNSFGNPVYQVLTDYQMAADGGNGIMTLFEFDLTNEKIDVETVSPWMTVKDEASLTSSDAPYYVGANQSFSIDFDFADRFGWTVDPVDEDNEDLSERAKEIVSEGWDGDAAGELLVAAGNSTDYVEVDGTVAHWRFGDVEAGVVDENTIIPDIAGESPMYRNAVDETDSPEELKDVNVSHDNTAYYSADQGSVCFTDVYRNASGPDRLSYLSTEYGAPATMADLNAEDGYTIETFLQLDDGWTETANRWGAALTRSGSREWTGINDSSDPGAGVAWLGISNLREYQYSAADTETANSYTLWSGEIMQGAWHHVAIVNDPADDTAIMYVDGVPVLRNASSVGGMMAADFMPWIIGASTWDSEVEHGWNGCVGETRVVDHAVSTDEFLFNRIDINGQGGNFALTTDLSGVKAPDAQVATFAGTGYAGASVRVERDGMTLGRADVADNGTWKIELAQPLSGSGAHELAFVQSIGERDGTAYEAVLVIGEISEWTPSEEDLIVGLENLVKVTPNPFRAGDRLTIELPTGHEGDTVYAFALSTPVALGAATVGADATATVSTPSSLASGDHRLAVYTADGDLIGWQSVSVLPDAGGDTDTDGDGNSDGGGADGNGSGSGGDAASDAASLAATGISIAGGILFAGALLTAGFLLWSRKRARRASM